MKVSYYILVTKRENLNYLFIIEMKI